MGSVTDVALSPPTEAPRRTPSTRRTVVVYAVLALLMVGSTVGLSQLLGAPNGVDRVIVIPAGTADRLAAGEELNIIPADLRLQLRDRLVVVNNDTASHTIGPFIVAGGQRLEKRLSEVASFSGFCSLHPSGNVSIEVTST
jgi:hypothetical protein